LEEKVISLAKRYAPMSNPERDKSGKLTEQYSDEDFLEAVKEHEPAGTSEVADEVGCSRRNADVRLRQLEEDGLVESKMAGNSLIWSPAE
jgi:predicted ArsR family transcriptional regulator